MRVSGLSRVTGWGDRATSAPKHRSRAQLGASQRDTGGEFIHLAPEASPALAGSRNLWARCHARTKGKPGKREPGRCKAAGQGVGGRCIHHGGGHVGWRLGQKRAGPKEPRKLVLVSGFECLLMEAFDPHRKRRRWHLMAIPLELFERLSPDDVIGAIDSAYVSFKLEEHGVPRKIAQKWPQRLGFRVILRLAERDRIAFGVMSARRDLKRAARRAVGRDNGKTIRIEADALLRALRAAGQRMPVVKGGRT
jgi:hypothetical protein